MHMEVLNASGVPPRVGLSPPLVNIPSNRADQDRETELAAFETVINRALSDSDAGKGKPADQVFDRLNAKYRAMSNLLSVAQKPHCTRKLGPILR